jgi:DNA repair protein RecO (recombination protein O)
VALVRTRAVVLQAFPYSDSSKILRLYTPELGLRSVIAKGAQRPRSRYGGVLEPFTEGEAHFHLREGRDLHTLSGFDLVRSRQALGRDLTAFAAASLVSELVLRSGTEEPNPRLYQLLVSILERLAEPTELAPTLDSLAAIWQLVAELGYQPELESCVGCGRPLPADQPTRFDVDAGGAACAYCRPTGRVIDPTTRAEIRRMTGGEPPRQGGGDLSLHRALLRVFMAAHLTHGTPLRSLPLYLEQLR